MLNIPNALARGRRRIASFAMSVMLLCTALLPALAVAQTSTLCPVIDLTVAYGGSVSVNANSCHAGFGLGNIATQATHGTGSVGPFGPAQQINYAHNGTSGAGTTDFFVVRDGNAPPNNLIRVNVTIGVATSAITVTPANLPAMTAGTPFSQTLTSTGGVAPYTYSLSGGSIPVGLTLSASGVISGTPTQRGGYTFSVLVQDNVGDSTVKGYTGTVANPSLALVPASATAIQGAPFSLALSTAGGVAPHTYQLETGTFPVGITISSAGVVSGTTAAAPGNYPVTLRVTDSSTGPGSYFELEPFTLTVSPAPSVSIAVAPASVSEDGATNLVYTLTRSLNLSSPTVVNITTGGTATSGADYTGGVATLSIPSGATTATITINPTTDATVEADETVILTVAAGTGYTVGAPASATGTILNDDVPAASITVAPASVAEDGATNLVYTVTLSQAPQVATSVNFTASGTATSGTDYAAVTSPVTIAGGATTGTVVVNPTTDATIEANETVILTLAAGAGYTVGTPAAATGTILNDDLPTLTINDVTLSEGNAGTSNATFTVSLNAPAGPGGVTFDIATANGTATAGVDYVASSLTGQTIPAGASTYSFTVLVNGDTLNETTETFFVNVTNVVNAVVGDGQGVGTIVNDDPLPSLSIGNATVTEGNAGTVSAVFTVTLGAASGQTVTVNYATADGTAVAPTDYTAASGTLTFAPGVTTQTVTVLVNGDISPEATETFTVNLSGATNATIATAAGTGTITNDDVPVTVNPATLPNATVATPYSQTLTASGGVAPYTYAVTAGALPAGLTLSPTGTLSGTPTAGGTFNFTVTATDNSPNPGPFTGTRTYALVVAAPTITLPATTFADAILNSAYSATVNPASGGTAPYTYAVTAGALPAGLTLTGNTISGTPTAIGTFTFSITATDSSTGTGPYTATRPYTLEVLDAVPVAGPVSITAPFNAGATNVPLAITAGTPESVAVVTPPTHGTAIASGITITYQPTAGYSGPDSFAYTATNDTGTSAPATVTVTVGGPAITVTASNPLTAQVGVAYSNTFTWSGGTAPYTGYTVTNLPAGITITGTTATSVTISGTPTQAGAFALLATATDSSTGDGPFTQSDTFDLTVAGPTLTMTPAAGTLTVPYGTAYTETFVASGGTAPYTYAVTAGALPPGLNLDTDGTLSGTATVPGTFNATLTATDSTTGTGAPFMLSQNYAFDVGAPTIAIAPATVAAATAGTAYGETFTASGGVAPYAYAITAGALPAGLTLAADGTLDGTPTVSGTFNFTVTATDDNGQTGSRAYALTVNADTLVVTPAVLPDGVAGSPYSQALSTSGGIAPYTYALVSGALPAGVTLDAGGVIAGTPTVAGTFNFEVQVTDSTGGTPATATIAYALVIAPPSVVINPATLPDGVAGSPYAAQLIATGGVAPYVFSLTAGALPTGVTFDASGAFGGTPTEAGSFPITITATDVNSFAGTRSYTLVIAAPSIAIDPAALPDGVAGSPYTAQLSASGGVGPYTYALTSGALPAGLTLDANGLFSGTPTDDGSFALTVTATDANGFTGTINYTLVIAAPAIAIDPATLPAGESGTAYSAQLTATGGVAPYTFAVTSGALPTGLTLTAGGLLSGTPTTDGSYAFGVTATDDNGFTGTRSYGVVIGAATVVITPTTLPDGIAEAAYSQTLSASGGTAPYTYAVTAGALPAGITLSSTGVLSGTPTSAGTASFTVTATDANAQTGVQAYTLEVLGEVLLPPTTLANATAGTAYTATLNPATGGTAPYTYAVTAGALPAGVTLSATGTLSGTPTIAGSFDFTVTATDSDGNSAARAYTLVVEGQAQVITFPPQTVTTREFEPGATFVLNPVATGGASGNPVTYTAGPADVCTISGTTVTMVGPGTCTITASQEGGGMYEDADPVTQVVVLQGTVEPPLPTVAPAVIPALSQTMLLLLALMLAGLGALWRRER